MKQPTVAIVGYGAVGEALHELFPQARIYDPHVNGFGGEDRRAEVNGCDFAFVSVPTPSLPSGACDVSIVEEVVSWIDSTIIILRSTVPAGTTNHLVAQTGKRIVFQPEYGPAETPDHPFSSLRNVRWVILGGLPANTRPVTDLYKTTFSSDITIWQTDAKTAELCKYMENAFYASKVTFCNEFYDIAQAMGVDYNELRELWLLDPRIGRSHTFVFPDDRGFGGKCLPKDLAAILYDADRAGLTPRMLRSVEASNEARYH